MLRSIVVAVIGCAVLATGAQAAPAERGQHPRRAHNVNAREHRQAARIRNGVKSGELTPEERNKLRADEAAIRAEERVYRKSGDGLSPRERRDLERDLNKTSREIRRAKKN